MFNPGVHEVERNKLTYDTELENLYVVGDFGVNVGGNIVFGERRTMFTNREFSLTASPKTVDISNITSQGYWFFSGKMQLAQKLTIQKEENVRYTISFSELNAPVAVLFVNGQNAGVYAFAPYELDVTDFIQEGVNSIVLCLYSSNRNLLGPHHYGGGESYSVGPDTFTDHHGWSDDLSVPIWSDQYCFVTFGAKL